MKRRKTEGNFIQSILERRRPRVGWSHLARVFRAGDDKIEPTQSRSLSHVRSKHHPFTLLEVLVTLTLLGIVGVLVSIQAVQLIKKHRFEKEVEDVFAGLQEAQLLAVAHNTEIFLEFDKKGKKLSYRLTTDEPLSSNVLNQKKIPLMAIGKVTLPGSQEIRLTFSSQGIVEPRGVLSLQSVDGERKEWIDLRGGLLLKHVHKAPPARGLPIPKKI